MQWRFGPFRLDVDNAYLWRGEERLVLRPKALRFWRIWWNMLGI